MESKPSYQKLLSKYGIQNAIPYADLLNCIEWHQKRLIIIGRDNTRCRICDKVGTDSIFSPGSPTIHFYEEFEDVEYEDAYGMPRLGVKKSLKRVDKPVILHVHHTYYILSHLPWDYPADSLETLCSECHTTFHNNNRVPVWKDDKSKFIDLHLTPCPRCHGAGYFPEYSHVQSGVCFYCKGAMYLEIMK
jgi:hypothetical protein